MQTIPAIQASDNNSQDQTGVPVVDLQALYDEHYSNPEVAKAAGTGEGLPPMKPGGKVPSYTECLRWLRRRQRRGRRRPPRQRRPRRAPVNRRKATRRQTKVDAARGPPGGDPDPDPDDGEDHWQPLGLVLLRLIDRLADDFKRGTGREAPP